MAASDDPAADASPSVLTIDLGAIAANYRRLAARLDGAECAAVVKANAYGLGAAEVAPVLAAAGARHFFVAHASEGVALRAILPAACAIYVLNGLVGDPAGFVASGLIPVLNDPGQLTRWRAAAGAMGRKLPTVLHIDTGMSRLGLSPAEAGDLAGDGSALAGLDLRYVMSHLVSSEEPDNPLNAAQLATFAAWRARWPGVRFSLANSSGIFLGPAYHFDLVRPGAALYGINPLPGQPNPMLAVARLTARIIQVHTIDHPQTVGYGATFRAAGPTRIATVAVGYADGWLRSASNRGSALVGSIRVPIVGRISMDLITLDITAAPQAMAGDDVELMGPNLPVDAVADAAATNGYEVLTRLGSRFRRVYVNGPGSA